MDRIEYGFHLFAGGGGGILGDYLQGIIPVGAVEIEEFQREVLLSRQRDEILPRFPIWDDVRTFRRDNKDCREFIERLISIRENLTISGGFPCQDISVAGTRKGLRGSSSGLWSEMARIIGDIRPERVYIENSPALLSPIRSGGRIIGPPPSQTVFIDLSKMGYTVEWGVVGAHHAGAPHKRDRIWIMATANCCGGGQNTKYGKLRSNSTVKSSINNGLSNTSKNGENTQSVEYSNRSGCEKHNSSTFAEESGFISRGLNTWWREDPAELPNSSEQGFQNGGTKEVCDKDTEESKRLCCFLSDPRNNGNGERIRECGENKCSSLSGCVVGGREKIDEKRERGKTQSFVGRAANGVANRVDRIKTLGNGQVPAVVEIARNILES